jgi:hypothetical protein
MLLKDSSHSEEIILFIFSNITHTFHPLPTATPLATTPEKNRSKRKREKCDYDDVNGILYPFEICEMLCTCGLLHCKASHFYRHLFRALNRDRIVERIAVEWIISRVWQWIIGRIIECQVILIKGNN